MPPPTLNSEEPPKSAQDPESAQNDEAPNGASPELETEEAPAEPTA